MNLSSIQIGIPRQLDSESPSKSWQSSIYREPISGIIEVEETGLFEDRCADTEHHGGPDKAINVYPYEHFSFWNEKFNLEMTAGAFGENFTVSGQNESTVCIGDIYQIGSAIFEVSQPRQPCWKLARKWDIKTLALRVQETGYSGWYLRVKDTGSVEAPQNITLIDRPFPQWTIAKANHIMYHDKENARVAHDLASCPALSKSWQEPLMQRFQKLNR